MKVFIHVNQHKIRSNKKHNLQEPVLSVKSGRRNAYGSEVIINGPSKVVYRPNNPLPCGAVCWIETESGVVIL